MPPPYEMSSAQRITRLEERVRAVSEDVTEIKEEIKPLCEAFQQAKGFKSAFYLVALLMVAAMGASFREISSWFSSFLK